MNDIRVFSGLGHVFLEVGVALAPLLVIFAVVQLWLLRLPRKRIAIILKGLALTFVGFVLFMQGVNIGFFPVGRAIGEALGGKPFNWILIPLGLVAGFVVTLAEPAVRVLNIEVEKVSGGYISRHLMLYTLSGGVAISVGAAMARILIGIPLWCFVVPGYLIAFLMIRYSSPAFTAIAFDSGGIVTGPVTVAFVLPMTLGVTAVVDGRSPLVEGFGMIALVALAPILAVLALGIMYRRKERLYEEDAKKEQTPC